VSATEMVSRSRSPPRSGDDIRVLDARRLRASASCAVSDPTSSLVHEQDPRWGGGTRPGPPL
jgi:hypothetical protein